MLDNIITLAVDLLNSGATTDTSFSRDEEYLNRSIYVSPYSDLVHRDILGFYRTKPVRNGNFLGVAKSSFKFTMDVVVPGADGVANYTQPLLAEVSFSVPVGTDAATVLEVRQRCIALLDNDSIMVETQEKMKI